MLHDFRLETERLILRVPTLDDAPAIQKIVNHPDIAAMTLNIPYPYPDDGAIAWIEAISSSESSHYTFLLELKENGLIIGSLGLHPHPRFSRGEIGYWLGVDFWNKGYMSEAVCALIEFGFETLKLERIEAGYFPENPASGRVMEKAGMHYECTLRSYVQKGNANRDIIFYAVIREDWLNGLSHK